MSAIAQDPIESSLPCNDLKDWRRGWKTKSQLFIHQRSCLVCCKWLYENDQTWFKQVLQHAQHSKRQFNFPVIQFAVSQDLIQVSKPNVAIPLLRNIIRSCPCYKIPEDLIDLPEFPGVYILTIQRDGEIKPIYVGMATASIRQRWTGRHQHSDKIETLALVGIAVSMYCLLHPFSDEKTIRTTEKELIRQLQPSLNVKDKKSLQSSNTLDMKQLYYERESK